MKKSTRAIPMAVNRKPRQADSTRTGKTQGPRRKLPQPVASAKPETAAEDGDKHNDSAELSLVRYINETMIKKMSGKDTLRDITTLNLTLTTKDDGKKIRYIENLEGLVNLQVLTISHNQISKIERLQHLTQLRELDISCNRLAKIEGLETLVHLQSLDLSHNLIETIPAWLAKKLKALRVLHIAGNLLYSLSDVFRLRPLKDLVNLSLAHNPLCDLPHHRLFAVFHLRTLQVLDKKTVTEAERQQANARFEQEELENLEVQLGEEEKKLRSLQEDHSKTLTEQKQSKNLISSLKTRNREHQRSIIQLQGELQAKNDLLKRKTAELNKACEKQYRLEQELAFHKIDAKFEPLAFYTDTNEGDGGTEESPYIGKAGYKRNELARQQYLTPKSHRIQESRQAGQDSTDSTLSPETHGQLQAILQDRLTDKQRQIAAAQEQLSKLQDKIDESEKALDEKHRQMQNLSAETPHRPLSEAEKEELKGRLWERLQAVNDLRQRVAELEAAMGETLDIIQDKEREMERLRRQLPDQRHPEYAEAATEMASMEKEATDAGDKYRDLQRELEEVVALLAEEMDKVNRVKQKMAQERVDLNDNLKDELEDTIAGLTDYMQQAQRRAVEQERKNQALQRERDQLLERLHQAERGRDDKGDPLHDFEESEEMHRKLDAAEAALAAAEAERDRLRTSLQAEHDEHDRRLDEEDEKLRAAEEEANKMNSALKRQIKKAQADKDALQQELKAQQREVEALRQSADKSHDPEEIEALANQLRELQAERDDLEDQLRTQQAEMQDALDSSLHPDDVVGRIQQMKRHLEKGRGKMKPLDEGDTLGKSLADVEDTVRERMRDVVGEREEAHRKQQKAEREADSLRRQVAALQDQLEQADNDRLRHGVDSPDLAVDDLKDKRRRGGAREDARDARIREEEDAVVEAMREEVQRLQEQLRRRPPPYHRDQARVALRPREDPHTMAELQQLEAALAETQRQMRDNDQLAAEELARAEAKLQNLREELNYDMMRAKEREREAARQMERERREADRQVEAAIAEAESRARERARHAAQELARAEDEMARLQQALANRESQLQQEMQHGDIASQTIVDQRTEIGALYDTLEDQKAEILKLQDALNRLMTPQPGVVAPGYDYDLEHLLREIERLKRALQQQRSYMSNPGILRSGLRPADDPRPTGNDLQRESRPAPYRYDPVPSQPQGGVSFQVPSRPPPHPPSHQDTTAASAHQTMPQPPPDFPSPSYPEGLPPDTTTGGQPQPVLDTRTGPVLPAAFLNPQGVDSAAPGAAWTNYANTTPHGNVRAVPELHTHQPRDQSQRIPQSSIQAMHAGMAAGVNGQPRLGNFPSVSAVGQPGENVQALQQAGNVNGQHSAANFPIPSVMRQPVRNAQVPQQTSISYGQPSATNITTSSAMGQPGQNVPMPQQAVNLPGGHGTNGGVQATQTATSGAAPPTSQPIMAQIPLAPLMGVLQGGATPGLALRGTVPAQTTAAANLASGSGDGAPAGNGRAETSTEGDTDSAAPTETAVPAAEGGKKGRTIILPPGGLFCNVPEHHDMEDEIARLKKLLAECRRSKRKRADVESDKLESVLEKRTNELETLELAIQRQRDTLRALHNADIDIQRKRDAAAKELQELRSNIDRQTRRRDFLQGRDTITPEEVDFEMLEASLDQDYLEDEIECLEKTLVKRRAELRVADRLLQECHADLKDATDKAKSTIEQYDKASLNLKRATEDAEEIEKRSTQVATDLVQAQQHLAELERDVEGMEEGRRSQKEKMRVVDVVLGEKDAMFRDLEDKIEQATDRLQKLQADFLLTEEKVAEQQESSRLQNQLIAERTAELHRLEEQVDGETQRLRDLNQEIGKKQVDLTGLTADLDTNSKEMMIALRDAESELASLKQRVKETEVVLDDLSHQKRDLQSSIEDQRSDLAQHHQDAEQADRALQDVRANIDRSRAELKHTLEMMQLEKTELEALRLQHETKMGDLEKAQLAALQEKAELETIQVTSQEKRTELERITKQLTMQRSEKERLVMETAAMEARAATLHKEEEILEERCRQWDSKVAQLSKQHSDLLDARKAEETKLDDLQQDMTLGQENLDKINSKRALLTNQFNSYKQQVKEIGKELRLARSELQETEDRKHHMQEELKEHERQKSEVRGDLAQLRASVEKMQQTLVQVTDEHRARQKAVDRLRREIEERHQEAENGQQHVERVQADVEQEENRLSRLIGGLTVEAEHLRSDIAVKRQELEEATRRLHDVRSQHEQQQQNRLTATELQAQITQLENEVKERQEEKTKLAEALNFSHTEINSLRKEKESLEKRLSEVTSQLDACKDRLRQAKQRFKDKQRQLQQEIEEANMAASQHGLQADRLNLRLKEVTQQYIQLQSQSSRELEEERKAKAEALEKLRELSRRDEVASIDGTSDLDELEDLQRQKLDLTRHLVELQSNIQQARLDASLIRDGDFLHDMSSADESRWRQDSEKAKMQEEQDRLKLQIRQRVSRQADMLDSIKEKANSTLHSLKRKLDNLEGMVSNNSAMARSLTAETAADNSLPVSEQGISRSDHYPQHDTSPVKMTPGHHKPLRGILKTSQQPLIDPPQVHQVSTASVPSRTYSSQRHRRTSPSRPEQPTHRQPVGGSERDRLDDFMKSIQRLKEEKIALIEQTLSHSTKPTL